MKRKLALVLTIVLVLSQVYPITSVFATRGKSLAVFKYVVEYNNGEKVEKMVTCARPNPDIMPEYGDGSHDEQLMEKKHIICIMIQAL